MCSLSNWVLKPSLHQHRECAVCPTGFCNHLYINIENVQSVQVGSSTISTSTSRMRSLSNWVLQPSLHQRRECAVCSTGFCNHLYINVENVQLVQLGSATISTSSLRMCSQSKWGTRCNNLYINIENAHSVQLGSASISTSTSRMCSLSNWVLKPSLHHHRECAVSPTGFCNHLYINVENVQSAQLGSGTITT